MNSIWLPGVWMEHAGTGGLEMQELTGTHFVCSVCVHNSEVF